MPRDITTREADGHARRRNRPRARIPLAVGLIIAAFVALPAVRTCVADINVAIDRGLSARIHVGLSTTVRQGSMLPVIFEFDNTGEPRSLRVVAAPGSIAATFSVPTGTGTRRSLYVPAALLSRDQIHCYDASSGRLLKTVEIYSDLRGIDFIDRPPRSGDEKLIGITITTGQALAVSEDLDPDFGKFQVNNAKLSVLPDSWLGYSAVDVVIIEHGAWAAPDFDRKPLIDWMATGGVCLIVGAPAGAAADMEKQLSPQAPFFRAGREDRVRGHFFVGMGGLALVDSGRLARSEKGFFGSLGFADGLKARIGFRHAPGAPEVEGVGSPPFLLILTALFAFALVVGPVGWWFLVAHKRRGLLYFVVAPGLSLAAMGLTVAVAFLHEGLGAYLSSKGVRFIDQRVNTRIDLSQFGVYVPFGFAGALRGEAEELPYFLSASDTHDPPSIRPTAGGREYSGLLPPRTRVWFAREAVVADRRRLVVWKDGGKIWVENQLGLDLVELLVAHQGQFACFPSLAAGAKTSGSPLDPAAAASMLAEHHSIFERLRSETILQKSEHLWPAWAAVFEKGHAYVAKTSRPIPEHLWLRSFRDKGTMSLVVGVY